MKILLYAFMRAIGLQRLVVEYEQRKLDRARKARFNAFARSQGYVRVRGKLIKVTSNTNNG